MRLDLDEKLKIDEQVFIVLNCSLSLPETLLKLPAKSFVDRILNDRSNIRNNTHVDFNDKKLDKVRFVKAKSMPAVGEHLAAK